MPENRMNSYRKKMIEVALPLEAINVEVVAKCDRLKDLMGDQEQHRRPKPIGQPPARVAAGAPIRVPLHQMHGFGATMVQPLVQPL